MISKYAALWLNNSYTHYNLELSGRVYLNGYKAIMNSIYSTIGSWTNKNLSILGERLVYLNHKVSDGFSEPYEQCFSRFDPLKINQLRSLKKI